MGARVDTVAEMEVGQPGRQVGCRRQRTQPGTVGHPQQLLGQRTRHRRSVARELRGEATEHQRRQLNRLRQLLAQLHRSRQGGVRRGRREPLRVEACLAQAQLQLELVPVSLGLFGQQREELDASLQMAFAFAVGAALEGAFPRELPRRQGRLQLLGRLVVVRQQLRAILRNMRKLLDQRRGHLGVQQSAAGS